jgi:hypothetical protein
MRRRFQFSLRALLCLTLTICLTLGGWTIFKKYGQYIEAVPIKAGDPIPAKGRLIRFMGPKRCHYCLDIFGNVAGFSGPVCLYTCYGFAERSGPFTYTIKAEYSIPHLRPGEYRLALVDGYHPEAASVFGELLAEVR